MYADNTTFWIVAIVMAIAGYLGYVRLKDKITHLGDGIRVILGLIIALDRVGEINLPDGDSQKLKDIATYYAGFGDKYTPPVDKDAPKS